METQSEIDEVVLSNVVESLLGKIRINLDISMQVLEAVSYTHLTLPTILRV